MKSRCPRAQFRDIALLPDHQLAFTRRSKSRGCGVADVVPAPGAEVWGVVYEVDDAELSSLDVCEGYRLGRPSNAYWRKECVVQARSDRSRQVTAITYFAEKQINPPPPNREYLALIISGAEKWGLPPDYVAQLKAIPTAEAQ